MRAEHARVLRGGEFDKWDLEVRGGLFGAARLLMAAEDHGPGTQYVRARCWPRCFPRALALICLLVALATWASLDRVWPVAATLAFGAVLIAALAIGECSMAMAAIRSSLGHLGRADG